MKIAFRIVRAAFACAACCAGGYSWAHGPGVHQHGVAKLEMAVDGGRLELHLESPLDNMIGFEHPPRTEKEKQQVRSMAQRFRHAEGLFVPTPAANCRVTQTALSSAAIPEALLAEGNSGTPAQPAPEAAPEEEGHADLDATIVFTCTDPAALKSLEVKLFSAFPGTRQVDTELVTAHVQAGRKLTAAQPVLAW